MLFLYNIMLTQKRKQLSMWCGPANSIYYKQKVKRKETSWRARARVCVGHVIVVIFIIHLLLSSKTMRSFNDDRVLFLQLGTPHYDGWQWWWRWYSCRSVGLDRHGGLFASSRTRLGTPQGHPLCNTHYHYVVANEPTIRLYVTVRDNCPSRKSETQIYV